MQSQQDFSATTVLVHGLKFGPVKYGCDVNGITYMELEDAVGWFFHKRQCQVLSVLIQLTDNGESDGWGSLTFEDEESVQKALKLSGTSAKDIEASDCSLVVERAQRRQLADKDQRLSELRDELEAFENEVRLREARCKQLGRDIEQQRERQSELTKQRDSDEEIKSMLAKKAEMLQALDAVKNAETSLNHELRYEESRTESLAAVICNVDPAQTRRHAEHRSPPTFGGAGEDAEKESDTPEPVPAARQLARTTSVTSQFGQVEIDVPDVQKLVRSTSVRSDWEKSDAEAPPQADAADGEESDWEAPTGPLPENMKRTSSSPWALKRQQSQSLQHEQPPQVVEDKKPPASKKNWGDMDPDEDLDEEPKAGADASESADAENTDATAAASPAEPSLQDCQVRLTGMPAQPGYVLVPAIKEELARIWKNARNQAPPAIERVQEPERKSWVEKASPPEYIVTFKNPSDAAWLVGRARVGSWARIEHVTIRGKIITAAWATPKATPEQTLVDVSTAKPKPPEVTNSGSRGSGGGKGNSGGGSAKGGGKAGSAQPAPIAPTIRPAAQVTIADNPKLKNTAWGRK